jgi:Alw26I/Eco31I/Esp3I family type II restriction m6 adenine DNA methyltransferase
MNRDQARTLIAQTFTQSFDKSRFGGFVVNVLNRIDESKAGAWNSQYIKDAFKDHVQRYERLGTYTSPDEEKLDILIVFLTAASKLERARTAIRNFVADHLKHRNEKEAALVAFVSPTEKQWRFSYVKMDYASIETESGKVGVETRLTPARRFSYLVGEGESCHTAQTRFLALLQDSGTNPRLADIEDAFSVEAVTKEFFTKYAELFSDINKALERLTQKDKAIRDEFKTKSVNAVDFAKKLMGQIVFLYFLQKKGWLGVAKGQDWGTGPHDFLRKLARGEYGKYDNFFNDILEPLFYDTLATDRGHEAWCGRFKCRIPFLNGGLFEPLGNYGWRKTDIDLPNNLFTNSKFFDEGIEGTGILDVFDRYNFTVNEAEPLETEVAIDPEMLGKVFENLIEENRRKGLGAYYTPREVVHYMCQQSLMNYLDAALNKNGERVSPADIDTFVHLGDQAALYEAARLSGTKSYPLHLPTSIETHARLIDEKLADITICDPAVGSGAFPVGMMTEIVRARSALTPYFNDVHERTRYRFKHHTIQSSLYGVDIDPGAVEIAKLRLWLSLVVDEDEVKHIKPLPNLDYKIVSGDSLLGIEQDLFNNEDFVELEKLKPRYFEETDSAVKKEIRNKIKSILGRITKDDAHFDFRVHFSEVFHSNKGFDVIIANPPYDVLNVTEGHKIDKDQLVLLRGNGVYRHALGGKLNLFRLFVARGLDLLAHDSCLTYIIPYGFMCDASSKHLRQFVLQEKQLVFIEAFPERDDPRKRLFENAKMSTCVILARNVPPTRSFMVRTHYARQIRSNVPTVHLDLDTIRQIDGVNYSIPLMSELELAIVKKLHSGDRLTVKEIGRCYEGEINLTFHKKYLRSDRNGHAKLIKGAAVQRYAVKERMSQGEIQYLDAKMFLKAFDSPKTGHHSLKRIVMQGMTGVNEKTRLKMTILDDGAFLGNSVNYILINAAQIEPEYLLAILNSRMLNWYFKLFSTNSNVNGYEVDNLPIKVAGREVCDEIKRLAQKILRAKEQEPKTDTTTWERDIDCRVYEMFGLTTEEINTVESAVK